MCVGVSVCWDACIGVSVCWGACIGVCACVGVSVCWGACIGVCACVGVSVCLGACIGVSVCLGACIGVGVCNYYGCDCERQSKTRGREREYNKHHLYTSVAVHTATITCTGLVHVAVRPGRCTRT